jgi:dTDP-L-rhamnose 4-epimerase
VGDRVLITGGAGFIGSHVADELLAHGYRVRALDNLTPQVHAGPPDHGLQDGDPGARPVYLQRDVELVVGDVRDPDVTARALEGVDLVVHLAAAVGVGQSMYQIAHYTSTNTAGTGILLEALAAHPVRRLVVASSMSIYGEGLYADATGAPVGTVRRDLASLRQGQWEPCDSDGAPLLPLPTPESKAPVLESVYALSKFDQERLCLMVGRAYGIDTLALRFFNVYGPRQSLANPYTGVLAIFAARLLAGKPPLINEDGLQRRDFVSVHDVARACRLALERQETSLTGDATASVLNIGSGVSLSILEVAQRLAGALDLAIEPEITGRYRVGDIRHCFADISLARATLQYEPLVRFEDGVTELADWLAQQGAVSTAATASALRSTVAATADPTEVAQAELAVRGLSIATTGRDDGPKPDLVASGEKVTMLSSGGAR